MRIENLDVISPTLFPDERWNEAEALGAITWLWLKTDYKHFSVAEMSAMVLPVLKNGQFALFCRDGQPLAYITWAWFSPEAESRYLQSEQGLLSNHDWCCGNRLWFINWFTPFGDSKVIRKLAADYLFPDQCGRALYHRGTERGLRIMEFKGSRVKLENKQQWPEVDSVA